MLPSNAFAPVKNADGAATDTPALAKEAINALHRRWLLACGATVASNAVVEINPRLALDERDLRHRLEPGFVVSTDHYFR